MKPTKPLDFDALERAIETAKNALQLFTAERPIVGPGGEINVPITYMGFAIDRVHYDPLSKTPSPKGRPVRAPTKVNLKEVRESMERFLRESQVIEAVEFREAEGVWVVPIAWNRLIVMHVKISEDGKNVVPDYPLTEEVRRRIFEKS